VNEPTGWREVVGTTLAVFAIAFVGCVVGFALWMQELSAPAVTILGSGDRLSLVVTDGPARLVLATGDDPIGYENALARVRPIYARRVDVLLLAGSGQSLLVPVAAHADPYVRNVWALALLPPSPEGEALGPVAALTEPTRVQLTLGTSVTVETLLRFGADPEAEFPDWRATIERGETRVAVYSDGSAAALFPPGDAASVVVIAGSDPVSGWELAPAAVLIANADAIAGSDLRDAFTGLGHGPAWWDRVHPGEALRLRFIPGGIELPADAMQPLPTVPNG
jgi:hypothetical protein